MRQELLAHTLFLVAAAGITYWAAQDQKEMSDTQQSIAKIPADTVVRLAMESADRQVDIVKKDKVFWVELTPKKAEPEAATADAGKSTPSGEQPADKLKNSRFAAGQHLEVLLKSLEPLTAERVIGKVPVEKLGEYGIDDKSPKTQIVTSNGSTYELKWGKKAFASGNRYVQFGPDGRILLMRATILEGMETAEARLFERRILSKELSEFSSALISFQAHSKRVKSTGPVKEDGGRAWTGDGEGEAENKEVTTWMDKFAKVRVQAYASAKNAEFLAGQAPIFTIEFAEKSGNVESLSFFKVPSASLPEAPERPAEQSYWLKIGRLDTFVSLDTNRISAIEQDLPRMLEETKHSQSN